jgi:hypothetical protein
MNTVDYGRFHVLGSFVVDLEQAESAHRPQRRVERRRVVEHGADIL